MPIRSRLTRLFLHWLNTNKTRFLIQPRMLTKRKKEIKFSFVGVPIQLRGRFSHRGISIYVSWKGRYWDIIADFDIGERRSSSGHFCCLCDPEHLIYYRTREELWIKHEFGPFLDWCNSTLVNARWLGIYRYDEDSGSTWAKLLREDSVNVEADRCIALLEVHNKKPKMILKEEVSSDDPFWGRKCGNDK